MGGKGQTFRKNRELTEIEQSIVLKIIERIFEGLEESWVGVVKLNLELKSTETNPQLFLQLFLPTEMVILMTMEVNIGESSGTLCICIPYVVLEPVANKLSSRSWFSGRKQTEDSKKDNAMEVHIKKVDLPITAFLGSARLKVSEILSLETSDVVPLHKRKDDEIEVFVCGKPMYLGRPGTHRNHRAFKVTEVIGGDLGWMK
jgi:flagellar motor switch protein FliM